MPPVARRPNKGPGGRYAEHPWPSRPADEGPSTIPLLLPLVIVAWNNLLHLLPDRVRAGSVTSGVALAGIGGLVWMTGAEGPDLAAGLGAGVGVGLVATAASGLAVWVLRAKPAWAARLRDPRIGRMSARGYLLHTVLRIPVVSALSEEILFRGVAWAGIAALAGSAWAMWGTSIGFGAWHVVVSVHQAHSRHEHVGRWVALSVATTSIAGLGFGWLRLVTGGVWAPAIVHAALNIVGSIGARMSSRMQPVHAHIDRTDPEDSQATSGDSGRKPVSNQRVQASLSRGPAAALAGAGSSRREVAWEGHL